MLPHIEALWSCQTTCFSRHLLQLSWRMDWTQACFLRARLIMGLRLGRLDQGCIASDWGFKIDLRGSRVCPFVLRSSSPQHLGNQFFLLLLPFDPYKASPGSQFLVLATVESTRLHGITLSLASFDWPDSEDQRAAQPKCNQDSRYQLQNHIVSQALLTLVICTISRRHATRALASSHTFINE